jgi:hypothetical protein
MAGMTPLTGHCNCGAVTFEITAPLLTAVYCHCTRCQRRSGAAASPQALVAPGSLRILTGEDQVRAWVPPDGAIKEFCGACGSHLWSRSRDGEIGGVRLGVIDGDPGVRPQLHQWVSSAAVWEPLPDDGLPRHEERRP